MTNRRLLAPLALLLLGACAHAPTPSTERATSPTWRRLPVGDSGLTAEWPMAPRISHAADPGARDASLWVATADLPDASLRVAIAHEPGGVVGHPIATVDELTALLVQDPRLLAMGLRPRSRAAYPGFHALGATFDAPGGGIVVAAFAGRERVYVAVAIAARTPAAYDAANHFIESIVPDASDALTGGRAAEDRWAEVYWAPEAFSIRMPPVARDALSEAQLGSRHGLEHVLEAREDGATYRLRIYTFEQHAPPLLEVAQSFGVADDARPIQASGFPGLEHTGDDGAIQRIYRTDFHIYIAEVEPTAGRPARRASAFVDSLHLL